MHLGFNLLGLQSNLIFVCSFHFRIIEGGSSRQLILPSSLIPTSTVLSGGSNTPVPPVSTGHLQLCRHHHKNDNGAMALSGFCWSNARHMLKCTTPSRCDKINGSRCMSY